MLKKYQIIKKTNQEIHTYQPMSKFFHEQGVITYTQLHNFTQFSWSNIEEKSTHRLLYTMSSQPQIIRPIPTLRYALWIFIVSAPLPSTSAWVSIKSMKLAILRPLRCHIKDETGLQMLAVEYSKKTQVYP